jgi:hypothetical protein
VLEAPVEIQLEFMLLEQLSWYAGEKRANPPPFEDRAVGEVAYE